jgi:hypothetical protein
MECSICAEPCEIPQGCACTNLYTHPQCIENFNNTNGRILNQRITCTVCNQEFGNNFIREIRKIREERANRSRSRELTLEEGLHNNSSHNDGCDINCINKRKFHKRCILSFAIIIGLICYILHMYHDINKYYFVPLKIKKNQVPRDCIANVISCDVHEKFISNGTTITTYKIASALIEETDVAVLFDTFIYSECPLIAETLCYNYKKYYAKNKNDIEKYFNNYMYFKTIIVGLFLYTLVSMLIIYNIITCSKKARCAVIGIGSFNACLYCGATPQ